MIERWFEDNEERLAKQWQGKGSLAMFLYDNDEMLEEIGKDYDGFLDEVFLMAEAYEDCIEDFSEISEWTVISGSLVIKNDTWAWEIEPARSVRNAIRWNGRLWTIVSERWIWSGRTKDADRKSRREL